MVIKVTSSGVSVFIYQPKVGTRAHSDVCPFSTWQVTSICIEVPQNHDALKDNIYENTKVNIL